MAVIFLDTPLRVSSKAKINCEIILMALLLWQMEIYKIFVPVIFINNKPVNDRTRITFKISC